MRLPLPWLGEARKLPLPCARAPGYGGPVIVSCPKCSAQYRVAVGVVMPSVWVPMPLEHWALTGLMGLELFVGGLLIIMAYRNAPVIIVAPMQYSQIIWAAILGWLLFDEAMTPMMIVGISIIIAAGLFILTRSNTAAAPN